MATAKIFAAWADVLRYPGDGGAERLRYRLAEIVDEAPHLRDGLLPLLEFAETQPETSLEELFTHTFDSNAERSLDLGWHLHGENYARGVFMVRMRQMLRDHDIEESTELPDHASHALQILARADHDLAGALAHGVVSPALQKVAGGFDDETNPYRGAITCLLRFIAEEYSSQPEVRTHG